MHEHNFGKLVAHAPYTVNPCSESQKTRDFAHMVLSEDIKAAWNIYREITIIFTPAVHLNQGAEKGIELISAMLNDIITPEQSTIVLLETMAGKGSEVGRTFEELKAIIDNMKYPQKVGVCMDSCHVSDGGYDIAKDLEGVLAEFDRIIGIDKLKAMHLNDSMNPLGSHKDRHAKIGEGHLGTEAFINIINHPKLKDLPFILETPNELSGYAREIKLLR